MNRLFTTVLDELQKRKTNVLGKIWNETRTIILYLMRRKNKLKAPNYNYQTSMEILVANIGVEQITDSRNMPHKVSR